MADEAIAAGSVRRYRRRCKSLRRAAVDYWVQLRGLEHSSFEELVLRTLTVYSRGALRIDPAQRLIYQFAALEGLLLKNASEPIQQNIADRMAFFATTEPDARGRIIASVKDAYHLRSQFLHHAKLSPDIEVLTRFARNSWQFLLVVISKMSDYQTSNDFFSDIEDIRLGRKPQPGKTP